MRDSMRRLRQPQGGGETGATELSPLTTANLRAGYVHDLAFRQFEVSDTRVFTRPQAGRAFVEGLICTWGGLIWWR